MKLEKKKIHNWDVLVFNDDGGVVITLDGEGGPVIGASNYSEAEEAFIEAMNFAESIQKLIRFKQFGTFN